MHTLIKRFQWPALAFAMLLYFSSCSKQYGFRNKVNNKTPQRISISFQIINASPNYLNKTFEDELAKTCLTELRKHGFVVSKKDTPDFKFECYVKVDSFYQNLRWSYAGGAGMGTSGAYLSDCDVRQLTLHMRLSHPLSNVTRWETDYGLYFFTEFKRDLKRAKGVTKYLIEKIP